MRARPTLLSLLGCGVLLAVGVDAGILTVVVPGPSSVTETDVRVGGREISLRLKGDTWQSNFAAYAVSVWRGVTSGSGINQEPNAFVANKATVLPSTSIVLDMRKNDRSRLAFILQPAPQYDIVMDEIIYITIPANATASGVVPQPEGLTIASFVIKAARSVLQVPAVITEDMIRRVGINITMLLLNGETFVTHGAGRATSITRLIELTTSSLFGVESEPNNFEARKGIILKPIGFDIISPFATMVITMQPDPMYNFYASTEVVNFTLPPVLITSGLTPTPLNPLGFVVHNSPGTVTVELAPTQLTPTVTETEIRQGIARLILVVKHDRWAIADNTSVPVIEAKRGMIKTFRSTDTNGVFNSRLSAGALMLPSGITLLDPVPFRNSTQRIEVRFEQDPQFHLSETTARETVTFYIPGNMLSSGIAPIAGLGAFQFGVRAMGSIEVVPPLIYPWHSGHLNNRDVPASPMIIKVRLAKDKWKSVVCREKIRTGFSSNLPGLAYGFMAKLNDLVQPSAVLIDERCPGTGPEECVLSMNLLPIDSYSLVPVTGAPAAEVITFQVPPDCVGFGIQPSGQVNLHVEVHPREVSYLTYMPPSGDFGEMFGVVYSEREFHVEVNYANPAVYVSAELVNSLKCNSEAVVRSEAVPKELTRCGGRCRTVAGQFSDSHIITFKPAAGAATISAGTWSVCVMFMDPRGTQLDVVRLGEPLVIETNPALAGASEEETGLSTSDLDPMVVGLGGFFALVIVCGLFFVMHDIVTKAKSEMEAQSRADAEAAEMYQQKRRGTHEHGDRFRSFTTDGFFMQEDTAADWEIVLEEETMPDNPARYAFAEYGEADPRVEFLRVDGMQGKAFNEKLEDHKNRLADVGMLEDEEEEEEEFEEGEEEEEEEFEEEEEEDDDALQQRRDDVFGDDDGRGVHLHFN